MVEYVCDSCNTTYPIDASRYKCDCGQALALKKTAISFPLDKITERGNTLWRYREAIPITDDASIISFGEGMTPLVSSEHSLYDHRLKLDFIFPTGSYKDRGASVLLSRVVLFFG